MIFIIKDDEQIRQRIYQFSYKNHINITLEGQLAFVEAPTEFIPEIVKFFKEFETKFVNDFGLGDAKF